MQHLRHIHRPTRSMRNNVQRMCALVITISLLVVGFPALTPLPAAADTPPPSVTCSGVTQAFDFNAESDEKTFYVYVPQNGKVTVHGSADIVARATTGGWETILRLESDPSFFLIYALLGDYWGGPYYNQLFSRSDAVHSGPSGVVPFRLSQQWC